MNSVAPERRQQVDFESTFIVKSVFTVSFIHKIPIKSLSVKSPQGHLVPGNLPVELIASFLLIFEKGSDRLLSRTDRTHRSDVPFELLALSIRISVKPEIDITVTASRLDDKTATDFHVAPKRVQQERGIGICSRGGRICGYGLPVLIACNHILCKRMKE